MLRRRITPAGRASNCTRTGMRRTGMTMPRAALALGRRGSCIACRNSCLVLYLVFMDKINDIRKERHCVYDLHAHLVFVTKYRHDVFTDEHLKALERIFSDVCASFDCRLEEFNGETDHVHLLVSFPRPWNSADYRQQPQGSVQPIPETRLPRTRPTLLEGATPLVAQLRGHGGRCAVGHAETVYREPEQTSIIPARPKRTVYPHAKTMAPLHRPAHSPHTSNFQGRNELPHCAGYGSGTIWCPCGREPIGLRDCQVCWLPGRLCVSNHRCSARREDCRILSPP